uniref:Uncharacterized protein n=1 Tax=Clytia hemisphaerica TaxID=252671 RepID=A0A7M5V2A2_9CNID
VGCISRIQHFYDDWKWNKEYRRRNREARKQSIIKWQEEIERKWKLGRDLRYLTPKIPDQNITPPSNNMIPYEEKCNRINVYIYGIPWLNRNDINVDFDETIQPYIALQMDHNQNIFDLKERIGQIYNIPPKKQILFPAPPKKQLDDVKFLDDESVPLIQYLNPLDHMH